MKGSRPSRQLSSLRAVVAVAVAVAVTVLFAMTVTTSTFADASADTHSRSRRRRLRLRLPSPSDLVVRDLDRVVPAFGAFDGTMYAGSLPMDHVAITRGGANPQGRRTGYLQFWLFVPNRQAAPDTIGAWFNGGPGCSSFSAGILFEHAPVTVPLHEAGWCCEPHNETLGANEYAWTRATTMLYVEQPIGVGFSEATNDTPDPSSEDDVASDYDAFLQSFYKVFDGYDDDGYDDDGDGNDREYNPALDFRNHNLTLVGESYAGIYIPSIARRIYLNNLEEATATNLDGTERFVVPLTGIAIGNGKIDALTQDPAVVDYAYWHGLIDGPTRRTLLEEWNRCVADLLVRGTAERGSVAAAAAPFHPFSVRDDCGVFAAVMQAAGSGVLMGGLLEGGPNIYEYSTWDGYAAADGDDGTVAKFYNHPAVQQALNVPLHRRAPYHTWQGCIPEDDTAPVVVADAKETKKKKEKDNRRRLGETLPTNTTTISQQRQRRRLDFMENDTPWSVTPYIAELLDNAKIDVLIYSGDRDIICCTQGSEEALRLMDWSGTRQLGGGDDDDDDSMVTPYHNAWTTAPRGLWLYEDYPAGYSKTYKNLNLVTVYNAGHMVRHQSSWRL